MHPGPIIGSARSLCAAVGCFMLLHSAIDAAHAAVTRTPLKPLVIERNWGVAPLTHRSRDNLPNPLREASTPYVPVNLPAIGDLFDLFYFRHP